MGEPPTPSQTVGPYFSIGLLDGASNELAPGGIRITGRVLDGAGEPVPDAVVEIWQADADGRYGPDSGWGRCGCEPDGRFSFATVKPGPVEGQAPHLTVMVFARGLLKPVLTRMYFPDEDEANSTDPILSALDDPSTLVARPVGDELAFDVTLQGDRETVFFVV
ncbi:MAG TPA: protocatechuate 3,4-dioxygenase subunit alpha [Gaiellaceae bacterium]|nr:protocatechuate 3,4-dioxygenase subunit alpha [Gaiellaceae bacterium]